METPDFLAKYGALLHILEHGEEDLDALATQEGYTYQTGRLWRDTHCEAVLGYMRAIRTDYEVLWQQTSGEAVRDAWLGAWLGTTEKQIRRLERRLRAYVLIQRIAPPLKPGMHRRTLRRFLFGFFPKVGGSEVKEILSAMHRIHLRGGATVFLP
jgi:hypothetical protein